MPRTPRIRRRKRPGRKPWYEIQLGGHRRYLGIDPATAYRKASALMEKHGTPQRPGTLGAAADSWLMTRAGTWPADMAKYFLGFAGHVALTGLGPDVLTEFERAMTAAGYSRNTIHHAMVYADQILQHAVNEGWLDRAPRKPRLDKAPILPKDVSPRMLAAVFAELDASPRRRYAARALRFILATGCRPGEACMMRWRDVDLRRGVVILARHKTDRWGCVRTIFLTVPAKAILQITPKAERRGHVFVSQRGTRYTVNGLRSVLRRLSVVITPNQLRHSFASAAIDQQPESIVASLLGHSDVRTVRVYARIRDQRLRQAAAELILPMPVDPSTPA